jgi:hypothetical protein
MYNIKNAITNEDLFDRHEQYVKPVKVMLKVYDDSMIIIDLANALKVGKKCTRYVIRMEDSFTNKFAHDFFNWLDDWSINEFIDSLLKNGTFRGITVIKTELKGINVFSPFAEIKPIRVPEKWTLPHVWKAILAGQIKSAYKESQYTDDYALDAAMNFWQGKINPVELAQKLIEHPSGWWVRAETGKNGMISLSVNCHHFDYNKLLFDGKAS